MSDRLPADPASEPSPAPPPPTPPRRDIWDKLQIILQPVGGLFTALAIALLGILSSQFLDERQQLLVCFRFTVARFAVQHG